MTPLSLRGRLLLFFFLSVLMKQYEKYDSAAAVCVPLLQQGERINACRASSFHDLCGDKCTLLED